MDEIISKIHNVFNKISAKSAGSWDLLDLADVCATTMFLTYEVNGYGFSTPCFSTVLSSHLYRKNGKVDSYETRFVKGIFCEKCNFSVNMAFPS